MDELVLHRLAADKLERGVLVRDGAHVVWAGPGIGQPCDICGEAITKQDVEIEVQFSSVGTEHRFHRRCHAVWDLERRRR
jgi:hypothetical protein